MRVGVRASEAFFDLRARQFEVGGTPARRSEGLFAVEESPSEVDDGRFGESVFSSQSPSSSEAGEGSVHNVSVEAIVASTFLEVLQQVAHDDFALAGVEPVGH